MDVIAQSLPPRSDANRSRRWLQPALLTLLRQQTRGKLRRTIQQLRNPQRALLTWFAFALLALFLALECVTLMVRNPVEPLLLQTFIPIGMLGICLLKLSRICLGQSHAGVDFRPAEVVLLQAGPFTHREIRVFKLFSHAVSIVITATFASVFLWADVHVWLAGFVGAFSAMLFMYLLYMLLAVVAARIEPRVFNLGRSAFCLFTAGILVSSLVVALANISTVRGGSDHILSAWSWGLATVMQSPLGVAFIAPFDLFTRVMLAESYGALSVFVVPCLAINAFMFWAVIAAEELVLNRKLSDERRDYERNLLTRQDLAGVTSNGENLRRRVPPLPWLSGAGPVAWRQLTAVRNSLGGVALCAGLFTLVIASATFLRINDTSGNAVMVWFGTVMITQLLLPGLLPFDFRRDERELTLLKTLPIQPKAIVMGQLLIPVAIATLCQALVVMLTAIVFPDRASVSIIGLAYFVPANLLIFGLENLAFLLYPYRLTSFDMQTTARRTLMLFAKMLILVIAFVLALTIALLVIVLSSQLKAWGFTPETVQMCAGAVLLLGWWMAIAFTWQGLFTALCWAYRRFDPCLDRVT